MQPLLFRKCIVYQILWYNSQQMYLITERVPNSLLLIIFPPVFNSAGWNPPTPFHSFLDPVMLNHLIFFPRMFHPSRLWEYKSNINPHCLKTNEVYTFQITSYPSALAINILLFLWSSPFSACSPELSHIGSISGYANEKQVWKCCLSLFLGAWLSKYFLFRPTFCFISKKSEILPKLKKSWNKPGKNFPEVYQFASQSWARIVCLHTQCTGSFPICQAARPCLSADRSTKGRHGAYYPCTGSVVALGRRSLPKCSL